VGELVATGPEDVRHLAFVDERGHLRLADRELRAVLDFHVLHREAVGERRLVLFRPVDDVDELLLDEVHKSHCGLLGDARRRPSLPPTPRRTLDGHGRIRAPGVTFCGSPGARGTITGARRGRKNGENATEESQTEAGLGARLFLARPVAREEPHGDGADGQGRAPEEKYRWKAGTLAGGAASLKEAKRAVEQAVLIGAMQLPLFDPPQRD